MLGVLPLVQRLGLVESLVALETDELTPQGQSQRAGQLGLADTGRPLDEDRLLHARGEVGDDRGVAVDQVADRIEPGDAVGDRRETGGCRPVAGRAHGGPSTSSRC